MVSEQRAKELIFRWNNPGGPKALPARLARLYESIPPASDEEKRYLWLLGDAETGQPFGTLYGAASYVASGRPVVILEPGP